jgi:hypothetical protein
LKNAAGEIFAIVNVNPHEKLFFQKREFFCGERQLELFINRGRHDGRFYDS